MQQSIDRYVGSLYLNLLHGNFLHLNNGDKKSFITLTKDALELVNDEVVRKLLSCGWREQLVVGWLCGLKDYSQFTTMIGDLLITSKYTYAGQGFCFALANFADEISAEYLMKYLKIYLPQKTLVYDQDWAMAALMWIDQVANTNAVNQVSDLWDAYEQGKKAQRGVFFSNFVDMMRFCQETFL